jgi:hypothetical protein
MASNPSRGQSTTNTGMKDITVVAEKTGRISMKPEDAETREPGHGVPAVRDKKDHVPETIQSMKLKKVKGKDKEVEVIDHRKDK